MKRMCTFLLFSLLMIFLLPSFVISERGIKAHTRRLALVIGNSAYGTAPLRNPVNDARVMADTLSNLGFEVIHKENAGQEDMKLAILDFGRRLRKGGIGLFYFAGHGIQVKGRNYLIPVDAKIESESDLEFDGIDAGRVLGKMEDAENDLNIVILDACRNNPFSRSFRSVERGLALMDAPKGSLIAYSTAPGSIASDGDGENSIYTKHLIDIIKKPGLTIEQVLKQVRVAVAHETLDKQIPWESSSLMGNFYFFEEKGDANSQLREEYQSWMSAAEYQNEFKLQIERNNYPKKIIGKCINSTSKFSALFVPYPTGEFSFFSYHGISRNLFNKRDKGLKAKGYRLIWSQSFLCNENTYFQATWVKP